MRLIAIAFLVGLATQALATPTQGKVGANKFDLPLQYLGTASRGDGGAAYRKVTQAMAEKAIVDAKNSGIPYLRVGIMGYGPSAPGQKGDLDRWRSNGKEYWAAIDQMMTDLSKNGILIIPSFVWNVRQLPAMSGETVRDLITKPESRSARLLDEYLTQFITRYRNRPELLFYEIGNELNLDADLDLVTRCSKKSAAANGCKVEGNYSTDEMIAFTQRVAKRIKSLDPGRPVSSGHAFPRLAAQHLRRKPEFSPGGPDWTQDNADEMAAYLAALHAGLEILSVHVYEDYAVPSFLDSDAAKMISFASRVARDTKKILFIGEFGGSTVSGISAFLGRALTEIELNKVPYSAFWVWEYYQNSTYRSFDSEATKFNVEPGHSDKFIQHLRAINRLPDEEKTGAMDKIAPIVVVTWPLQCSRVGRSFTVQVAASDNSGAPPQVELSLDSHKNPIIHRPPYVFELNSIANGEHTLNVIAEDKSGNRATWKTTVLIGPLSHTNVTCMDCCN